MLTIKSPAPTYNYTEWMNEQSWNRSDQGNWSLRTTARLHMDADDRTVDFKLTTLSKYLTTKLDPVGSWIYINSLFTLGSAGKTTREAGVPVAIALPLPWLPFQIQWGHWKQQKAWVRAVGSPCCLLTPSCCPPLPTSRSLPLSSSRGI